MVLGRGRALEAAAVAVVSAVFLVAATPAERMYRPPVDAPVSDPFRPPPEPWLAGNRGIEYETVPGSRVGAIGPGVVVFAGPVAGALYVTVLHPDGLRSSYSWLAAIRVSEGDRVQTGDVVGIAGAVFHIGVRRGDTYIDPATLWGTHAGWEHVYLVPEGSSPVRDGPRRGRRVDPPHQTKPAANEPLVGVDEQAVRSAWEAVGARLVWSFG